MNELSNWFLTKTYIDAPDMKDYIHNYISKLKKSQLVQGALYYKIINYKSNGFKMKKTILVNKITEFIKLELITLDDYHFCFWGKFPDKWICEMCNKEYEFVSKLGVERSCADGCCHKLVCKEKCYEGVLYRYD